MLASSRAAVATAMWCLASAAAAAGAGAGAGAGGEAVGACRAGTATGAACGARRVVASATGRRLRRLHRGHPPARRCVATAATRRTADGATYDVHAVAGDGRCLFRSVAAAMELARAGARASDAEALSLADALRARACDELVARREDVEWFIEGDFETYVERMRNPWAWGGEPEILMLARALRTPIEVFVVVEGENASAREGGELRSIGRYGEDEEEEEDGDEEEEEEGGEEEGASGGAEGGGGVAVLFHGAGHYEALTRCDDDDAARR